MSWRLLLVAAAGCLLAAKVPSTEVPAQIEPEQLQGSWVVVAFEVGGKATDEWKGTRMVVAGEKMTLRYQGKQQESVRFKLNPSKKPRQIDLNPEKPTFLGIYSLEGDTLKLCWNIGSKDRPTAFATKNSWRLAVFKRVKQ